MSTSSITLKEALLAIDYYKKFAEETGTMRLREVNELHLLISKYKNTCKMLTESEERFRAIFESTSDCIVVWDKDYNCLFANQSAISHVGTTREKVIGKNIRDGLGQLSEIANRWVSRVDTIFKTGQPLHVNDSVLFGNRIVHSESILSPIKDESGNTISVGVVYRDISSRIKAEEERSNMQKQLFQTSKLATLGTVAAGIAHEINNPLCITSGYLELMHERLSELSIHDEIIANAIFVQKTAIERISAIVKGLGLLVRNETSQSEAVDVHILVSEAASLMQRIYKKDDIIIDVETVAENYTIWGNRGYLQQTIFNIFSNAHDAIISKNTHDGGRILIKTFNLQNKLMLEISDNGMGISKTIIDRIFDPFFTTKIVGQGVGLGLSLVQSFITGMNGKIGIKKTSIEGTTIQIELPCTLKNSSDIALPEKTVLKKLSGHILLVEDEENIRNFIKDQLESFGLMVTIAENGKIALDLLMKSTNAFDLLITDICMPEMNGIALIENIKKNGVELKYLIVSGCTTFETAAELEALNFINQNSEVIISKPFSKETLYLKIARSIS
ncbi:MAG: response regulator [Oligoflexia bacterium]|nr:response regulator [Oligoflexia bacterium]